MSPDRADAALSPARHFEGRRWASRTVADGAAFPAIHAEPSFRENACA